MSAKDLMTEMENTLVDNEADLAASALSILASSDPMQGLQVMAKAAGEAEPHTAPPPEVLCKLIDGDVEVVVPVTKTTNETMILGSAYVFDRVKELSGKLHLGQKRGIITSYLRGLDIGFMEQNLAPFRD